jgi:hypothetical protein
MKMIKPSTNVKYIIESNNGLHWEELSVFAHIQKAIDYLETIRKAHPNHKYRLVRSEWQVID